MLLCIFHQFRTGILFSVLKRKENSKFLPAEDEEVTNNNKKSLRCDHTVCVCVLLFCQKGNCRGCNRLGSSPRIQRTQICRQLQPNHTLTPLPQADRLIAHRRQQKYAYPSTSSSSFVLNYETMLYNDKHQQWSTAPIDLSHQLSVIGASVSCVLWYSFTFDECYALRVFWSPGYLSPTDVLINNKLSEECVSSASLLCDYRDKRAFEVSILIQRHFIR